MEALSVIFVIFAVISSLARAAQRKNGNAQQRVRQQRAQKAPQPRAVMPTSPAPAPQAAQQRQELRPTVSVTPHTEETFLGSLGEDSLEGVDPCHEDELAPAEYPCQASPDAMSGAAARPRAAAQPSKLNLRWSGDEMLRAVVMSEILTRPCDRRRR